MGFFLRVELVLDDEVEFFDFGEFAGQDLVLGLDEFVEDCL